MTTLFRTILLVNFCLMFQLADAQECQTPYSFPNTDYSSSRLEGLPTLGATVTVGIFAHIVRRNDGSGGFDPNSLSQVRNAINSVYIPIGMRVEIIGYDFINSSQFFDIQNEEEFNDLVSQNSTCNAIDMYLVSGFTGAGRAVAIPSTAFLLRNDYATKSTSPHELGHCLNLFHTHHGDAIVEPASEFDPNACEELVDGSNSATCGDYVVDTPADPGLSPSVVNANCNYIGTETQSGVSYTPDVNNLMSYSRKQCRTEISSGQRERMIDILFGSDYNRFVIPTVSGPTLLCTSAQGTYTLSNVPTGASVNWTKSSNLTIISQSGNSLTVQAPSTNGTTGWVRPTITGTCGDVELGSQTVWIQNSATLTYQGAGVECMVPEKSYSFTPAIPAMSDVIQQVSINTNKLDAYIENGSVYVVNNSVSPGSSQSFTITLSLTDNNGCAITGTRTGVFYQPTPCNCGYDDPSCNGGGGPGGPLLVFPNPTEDEVTIEHKEKNDFDVWVYDFSNNLILSGTSKQGQLKKVLSGFGPGTYIILIETLDGKRYQTKVVKN